MTTSISMVSETLRLPLIVPLFNRRYRWELDDRDPSQSRKHHFEWKGLIEIDMGGSPLNTLID